MSDALNREGHIWTPSPSNLLGFCVIRSPRPATHPGNLRLLIHGCHIPARDEHGVAWCLRCGKNLEAEDRALEQRERSKNVSEV